MLVILFIISIGILMKKSYFIEQNTPIPQQAVNISDYRSIKRILFIGNSRTYENNLPDIVKNMAESTTLPFRYEVTIHAPGGHNFQDHYTRAC